MANKRSNKKNRSRKNQSRKMRGGNSDFNVPIRAFYPQNTFAQDPSREMTTSMMKGGKKNHSRKYLKKRTAGGSGFLNNFGSLTGSHAAANQITGIQQSNHNFGQTYKV